MATLPPVTTVLFDLDGTLVDTIELILCSMHHAFRTVGIPAPSDEEWTASIGTPLFISLAKYAKDDAELQALHAAYRQFQIANHDEFVTAYAGATDVVGTLRERGHEMGIVTSKSEFLALRALTHVGLATAMDTIVGCDGCSRHKPHPEPVQVALARLGCPPDQALFIGDSVHDLHAGKAAGVRTVAALWGAFRRDAMEPGEPDFWLNSISELPALIQTLQVVRPSN